MDWFVQSPRRFCALPGGYQPSAARMGGAIFQCATADISPPWKSRNCSLRICEHGSGSSATGSTRRSASEANREASPRSPAAARKVLCRAGGMRR